MNELIKELNRRIETAVVNAKNRDENNNNTQYSKGYQTGYCGGLMEVIGLLEILKSEGSIKNAK